MINTIPFVFVRFPEGRAKALTFSYDDGFLSDTRFVDILNKHKMKGTFNISTGKCRSEDIPYVENSIWNFMKKSDLVKTFADTGHEIAVHGFSHSFLATLPPAAIAHEVLQDREQFEQLFGRIVRGMAYPHGSYDDKVIDVLKSCGIVYARTADSTERFDLPTDWFRLSGTCHHNNPRLMDLAKKFVEMPIRFHSQLFYLWGHTYEFCEHDNWNVIEEFTEYMSGREADIWYASNIEIYEYIEDFNHLIYSADLSLIKNPTNRKLWFSFNDKLLSIEPGETIKTR